MFLLILKNSIKIRVKEVLKREIFQEMVMTMVEEEFEKWWKEENESQYILQTN